MIKNYHTHTYRCRHASGEDEEYVLAAIASGFKVLGFSDHTPWNYDSNFVSRMRMRLTEFDDYYQSIKRLQLKYRDQIKILIGLEAEYFPRYMPWFDQFIKEKKIDYVLFGNHFYLSDESGPYFGRYALCDEGLEAYYNCAIAGMEYAKFAYFAHPDLYMRKRTQFGQKERQLAYKLCEFAKEKDIILEYNLEGQVIKRDEGAVGYPCLGFWEIAAEIGNRVIIGVDAHNPVNLRDQKRIETAEKLLKGLGITVTEEIKLLNGEDA